MAQAQANPADKSSAASPSERKRIPMSVPQARLAVPDIPGYHMHWFRGEAGRIQRAMQAGYEFVDEGEVQVNNRLLGLDPIKSGNTDMGTRVSQIAGGDDIDATGQATRLYLMKIKQELWEEDQKALTEPGSRLDGVRKGLLGGTLGSDNQAPGDRAQTYLDPKRTKMPDFLKRKN